LIDITTTTTILLAK